MNKNVRIFFILAAGIVLTSCGLDTFYTVNPPYDQINFPFYDTIDNDKRYVEFRTNTTPDSGTFKYLGTEVYYKIFANSSTLSSAISSIDSVNTSSNYSGASQRLASLGYCTLGTLENKSTPLIDAQNFPNSCKVRIRLTDYNPWVEDETDKNQPKYNYKNPEKIEDRQYYAHISIVSGGVETAAYIPRREDIRNAFDFGRHAKNNNLYPVPVEGDKDYSAGSFTSGYPDTYFVDLYAISVGRDATYTKYYSQALHLGTVQINGDKEQN